MYQPLRANGDGREEKNTRRRREEKGKTYVKITTRKKKTKRKQQYLIFRDRAHCSGDHGVRASAAAADGQQMRRRRRGSDDMATVGNPGPVNRSVQISENFRRTDSMDYRLSPRRKRNYSDKTNNNKDKNRNRFYSPICERRRTLGTARQ